MYKLHGGIYDSVIKDVVESCGFEACMQMHVL